MNPLTPLDFGKLTTQLVRLLFYSVPPLFQHWGRVLRAIDRVAQSPSRYTFKMMMKSSFMSSGHDLAESRVGYGAIIILHKGGVWWASEILAKHSYVFTLVLHLCNTNMKLFSEAAKVRFLLLASALK